MSNIVNILEKEITEIEYKNLEKIPLSVTKEVLSILKDIDKEMSNVLSIFEFCLEQQNDESVNSIVFYRLLKFYGLKDSHSKILETRQKFVIKGKSLVKKPFLTQKDKKHINILLEDYGLSL